MTCGVLGVMRRERRGVLHLDKYSPPKEICSVGKEERKKGKRKEEKKREKEKENKEERQRKGKRTNISLINKQRSCSS